MHLTLKIISGIWIAWLLCYSPGLAAQDSSFAKPGPSGVFIFLGDNIPSGKTLSAYQIERRANDEGWKTIAAVKTPLRFEEFQSRVIKARNYFPSQVLPNESRLRNTYENALKYGTVDSLTGWKLYPVRVGLGILYYDENPPKNVKLTYKVIEISPSGNTLAQKISDPVMLPFTQSFDSIYVAELSHSGNTIYIKWCSAGKNAAPLFTVYRFDDRKPVTASGKFGRFTVNDTTYFTYTDSLVNTTPFKELQYFIVPYDLLGNAAKSSQIALFPDDDFERSVFKRFVASNMMEYGGIRLSWRMSNPLPVENISVYRSESPNQGFVKYHTLKPNDTVWIDENTWPDKVYYYYLSAKVKNGKRIKNSPVASASAFYPTRPIPPVISRYRFNENGMMLVIDAPDPRAIGARIFRGNSLTESFNDISGLVVKTDASHVIFTDTTLKPGRKPVYYVARIEGSGQLVSDLSAPVKIIPPKPAFPENPAYLKVYDDDNQVKLFWEDMMLGDTTIAGYLIERQEKGKTPVTVAGSVPAPLQQPFFTDETAVAGSTYTYTVRAIERSGAISREGTTSVITFWGNTLPVPSGLKGSLVDGKAFLSWDIVQHSNISSYNLYRYEKGSKPQIISSPAPENSFFTDEKVLRKKVYHYFITAVDRNSVESARSNEVTVKID